MNSEKTNGFANAKLTKMILYILISKTEVPFGIIFHLILLTFWLCHFHFVWFWFIKEKSEVNMWNMWKMSCNRIHGRKITESGVDGKNSTHVTDEWFFREAKSEKCASFSTFFEKLQNSSMIFFPVKLIQIFQKLIPQIGVIYRNKYCF